MGSLPEPVEGVDRLILLPQFEVQLLRCGPENRPQRYHIPLGHLERLEPSVEGQNAPRVLDHDGQSVALEGRSEDHATGVDGPHNGTLARLDGDAVVGYLGAIPGVQPRPEVGQHLPQDQTQRVKVRPLVDRVLRPSARAT